jgi:hypothetical protein
MPLTSLPEWIGAALLTAALAALGYVTKHILEWIGVLYTAHKIRRARLVTLLSLLQGARAVFRVQAKLRDRLFDAMGQKHPDLAATYSTYDAVLSAAFPTMNVEERDLHTVIRAYTVNGIKPLNEAILQWLQADTEFKLARFPSSKIHALAQKLEALEPHLLMWLAKYSAWIPDSPSHALVYLADEEGHGVPFPRGIENTIRQVLNIPVTQNCDVS